MRSGLVNLNMEPHPSRIRPHVLWQDRIANPSMLPLYLDLLGQSYPEQDHIVIKLLFDNLKIKTGCEALPTPNYNSVREPLLAACKKHEGKSDLSDFYKEVGVILRGISKPFLAHMHMLDQSHDSEQSVGGHPKYIYRYTNPPYP